MEKKRKRASFTVPSSPKEIAPETEAEPTLYPPKQVVEVVTEEEEAPRRSAPKVQVLEEESRPHHAPQPVPHHHVEEEEEGEVVEVPSVIVETPKVVVQKPKVVEIVDDIEEDEYPKQVERPRHIASSVTNDTPEEVTVVASAEPEEEHISSPQVKVLSHDGAEREESEQKKTVAELFGRGPESPMPEITVHRNKKPQGILLWAITMLAIAIGVGGGLILFTTPKSSSPTKQPSVNTQTTPSVQPTAMVVVATPTPTTAPAPVSRKDLKVQVQNGGGVVGAGSKMKNFLEDKGYTVSDVRNADDYTHESTTIQVKSSKSGALPLLKTDLGTDYTVSTAEATLPESSAYDAVVVVGKK